MWYNDEIKKVTSRFFVPHLFPPACQPTAGTYPPAWLFLFPVIPVRRKTSSPQSRVVNGGYWRKQHIAADDELDARIVSRIMFHSRIEYKIRQSLWIIIHSTLFAWPIEGTRIIGVLTPICASIIGQSRGGRRPVNTKSTGPMEEYRADVLDDLLTRH